MSKIRFLKMHSLGNDFVVLDGVSTKRRIDSGFVQRIADRRRGVGCDQVLLLEESAGNEDFRYRIWNSDGSEVAQCGNGARCIPEFASRFRLLGRKDVRKRKSLRLETFAGCLKVKRFKDGSVRARLGELQFMDNTLRSGKEQTWSIPFEKGNLQFDAVLIGNPHAVFVADRSLGAEAFRDFDLAGLAEAVRGDTGLFPNGVNVGLCRPKGEGVAELRVDERGARETQACGSGAAAAAGVLIARRGWPSPIRIELPGGSLEAGLSGSTAWIQGNVSVVFEGTMEADLLQ